MTSDKAEYQFRILNSNRKGRQCAPLVQADRVLYKAAIRHTLENQRTCGYFQQACDDRSSAGSGPRRSDPDGTARFHADNVVNSAPSSADLSTSAWRTTQADAPATRRPSHPGASSAWCRWVGRLKTGTPPRIDRRSVDFSVMTEQPGDTRRSR